MNLQQLLRDCRYSDNLIPLSRHVHNDYEMIYVKSGISALLVEGKTYKLKRGALAFISRLEDHSITILTGSYERYYVIIGSEQLDDLVRNPRLASVFRNRPESFSHMFDMSSIAADIEHCFSRIVQEYDRDEKYAVEQFNAYLTTILVSAYRLYPEAFPSMSSSFSPDIFAIQKYIEDHYAEDIRITDIAAEHFLSLHYLSRRFKEQIGYSPKQYLVNTRLAHAKALLLETGISVSEVAFKCGFFDVNNFIRVFREREGVTPYKYRNSL